MLYKHDRAITKEFERLERKLRNVSASVSSSGTVSVAQTTSSSSEDTLAKTIDGLKNISNDYIATESDKIILCNTESQNIIVTLPRANLMKEVSIKIKKISLSNYVQVKTSGENIDNEEDIIFFNKTSITFLSDGINWWMV